MTTLPIAHLAHTLSDGCILDIRCNELQEGAEGAPEGVSAEHMVCANVFLAGALSAGGLVWLSHPPKQRMQLLFVPQWVGQPILDLGPHDMREVFAAIESCVHDLYDLQPERRAQAEEQHGGMAPVVAPEPVAGPG